LFLGGENGERIYKKSDSRQRILPAIKGIKSFIVTLTLDIQARQT